MRRLSFLASVVVLAAATPARSVVTYNFVSGDLGVTAGFVLRATDYQAPGTYAGRFFESCHVVSRPCSSVTFAYFDLEAPSDALLVLVHFSTSGGLVSLPVSFRGGRLDRNGTWLGRFETIDFGFSVSGAPEPLPDPGPIDPPPTVVPEPGTWALLIAGFGLTGAALRHRRSRATTA